MRASVPFGSNVAAICAWAFGLAKDAICCGVIPADCPISALPAVLPDNAVPSAPFAVWLASHCRYGVDVFAVVPAAVDVPALVPSLVVRPFVFCDPLNSPVMPEKRSPRAMGHAPFG